MMRHLDLANEPATERLGRQLAAAAETREIVTLSGALGTGKTVFARAFIRALVGARIEVPSPTFTLVQTYETARGVIWHFDLYRLVQADQVWELGFEDALADFVTLIEWPERLGDLLPQRHLELHFTPGPEAANRQLTLRAAGGSLLAARAGLL
jgi:tRNA threonylcarbamoyladenosine biosynthesis protein TsaE